MNRLSSIEDFKDLQERLAVRREWKIPTIIIPAGTCGQASGANDIMRVVKRQILARNLTDG